MQSQTSSDTIHEKRKLYHEKFRKKEPALITYRNVFLQSHPEP